MNHGQFQVGGGIVHRDAARLGDQNQEHRGEGQHLGRSQKSPGIADGDSRHFGEAGGVGPDRHRKDRQHHGRFGQRRDSHLPAAAQPAERAARIEAAERQEEAPQAQQIDHGQHPAEKAQRGLRGEHRHHQARGRGGGEHHVRRRAENPGRGFRHHHALVEELVEFPVGLQNSRSAADLKARLQGADEPADQWRERQQKQQLQQSITKRRHH